MLNFKSIIDLIRAFPNEQSCIDYLENIRWNGNVISPFDKTSKVYKCRDNKYRCRNTGKYFNAKTNTIFEGSKISLQTWFMAIYLFTSHKRGISSYQLANDLNITQKSAWFMLQRIRYATEHESFLRELNGVVQCDETFVGGKNKNRHRDKKVAQSQGRSFKDKTPVFGAIEKGGLLRAKVILNTSKAEIQPLVHQYISKEAILMTDEWKAYKGLERYYTHSFVDHGKKQYADGDTTTNAIENFWSHFKRSIIGVYYHASRKHMQQYVNENVFRFNFRNESINNRFDLLLETTNNKRLKYKALIS